VAAKASASLDRPCARRRETWRSDERMLAARIEPKNGLQIQTAGFRPNQTGVDTSPIVTAVAP
jgi:hypothetical protein